MSEAFFNMEDRCACGRVFKLRIPIELGMTKKGNRLAMQAIAGHELEVLMHQADHVNETAEKVIRVAQKLKKDCDK